MPALCAGDYLLVRHRAAIDRPLARSAIVVVALEGQERGMLKRVVGLPGEQVTFGEGMLLINGKMLVEPYLRGLPPYLGLGDSEFSLDSDQYFVMGDNRTHSTDSRHFGPVRFSQVEGNAALRVWPLLRFGRL